MDLSIGRDPEGDPAVQQLLAEGRPRRLLPLAPAERRVEIAAAASFAAVAVPFALIAGGEPASLPLAVALTLAFAVASRVEFFAGAGYTVPTQLVLVPMLLLLPPAAVPLLVALGFVASRLPDLAARRIHPERALVPLGDAWHALAPAAVLAAAGAGGPDWGDWPLYLAALAAQLAADLAISSLRERLELGVPLGRQLPVFLWVGAVDALLAPIGLLAAFAGAEEPAAAFLVLPAIGLLALFAIEREARIRGALELSAAYRGTAMLLGDVIGEADEYTGEHSRSVVSLALEVADALGLDARRRRNVEFAALLHDVGKIAIPQEIINKPGPLDDEEWAIMKRHTIEGYEMLRKVGGVLEEVGRVVRASHERWDGRGYPDGLTGEEIPLEAAIVSACDSFDAMTTDRSYRRAMSLESALHELRENAGSQFHPRVVAALFEVLERERAAAERTVPDSVALAWLN